MSRLSLQFGNGRGMGKGVARRRLSLFWRAVQCGFALDWKRFSGLAARVLKFCADGTYEKALLGGLVPLARNERGDLRRRLRGGFEGQDASGGVVVVGFCVAVIPRQFRCVY